MAGLRYPLMYQCKRCEEVYEGLHRSKIHVKEEHGIAWKRTRKELRVIGIHEPLPTIELLPSEIKKEKRVHERKRPLKCIAFAIGKNFAHFVRDMERSAKKSGKRTTLVISRSHKTRLIEVFAYKGYLKDLPILGLLKLDQSGKSGGE